MQGLVAEPVLKRTSLDGDRREVDHPLTHAGLDRRRRLCTRPEDGDEPQLAPIARGDEAVQPRAAQACAGQRTPHLGPRTIMFDVSEHGRATRFAEDSPERAVRRRTVQRLKRAGRKVRGEGVSK